VSKRTIVLMALGAVAALVIGWQVAAFAGSVLTNSGFEGDDGNLVDNTGNTLIDWNTFSRVTWSPSPSSTPTRTANKTDATSGYKFTGIEDWVETTLFRVIQEALTNIRKHAEATKVRIVLDRPGNVVRLLVQDEGRGFVPNGATRINGRGEKVGLSGMRERVVLLGGRFAVRSEPGRGTTIEVEFELPQTGVDHEG
jgi:Histidine kinase-, DNA gyrase B-, and HSP90-like ATPase